jgi:hypothetical protein
VFVAGLRPLEGRRIIAANSGTRERCVALQGRFIRRGLTERPRLPHPARLISGTLFAGFWEYRLTLREGCDILGSPTDALSR